MTVAVAYGSGQQKKKNLTISMKIWQHREQNVNDLDENELREIIQEQALDSRLIGGLVIGILIGAFFASMIWASAWPVQSNTASCTASSQGLCWAAGK